MTVTDWVARDVDDVVALAARCLAADGGLPLTSEEGFVRRRWTTDGAATRVVRDEGRLVAAALVRPTGSGVAITTLVDPVARSAGHGAALLDWALGEADARDAAAVVETEALTPAQDALFATRGLRQVFAEDVLHRDLSAPIPSPEWPDGVVVHPWDAATAPRFFAVYDAAFRERPGFPGLSAETWIGDLEEDDDFRPAWSLLAEAPGVGDVGFLTAQVGFLDQVGVRPEARGRGLAAALVLETLARMRADGGDEVWLNVNVDNPAKSLYLRLGFLVSARRARFRR